MVGTGATLLITSAFADPAGPVDTGWEDDEFHPAIPVIKITTLIIDDEVFESKKLIFANGDQPKLLAVYTNPISNTDLQYSAVTYEYGKQQQGYVLIIEPVSATDTTKTRLAIPDYDKTEDGRAPWQKHGVNFNEIYIADGVTAIGDYAFYDTKYLQKIEIPMSVTSIGDYAFGQCPELQSINLSRVGHIGNYAFSESDQLQFGHIGTMFEGEITIGDYAFTELRDGKDISGADTYGYLVIGDINPADGLKNTVKSIGKSAFSRSNLTTVKIGSGSASQQGTIGETAFANRGITTLEIGDNVSIGTKAFYKNTALQTLKLGTNVSIGSECFRGAYALTGSGVTDGTLDLSGVTSIGAYAFESAVKVKKVVFSNRLTSMGSYAFNDCIALQDVNLVDTSLTAIPAAAFQATSLKTVTIPKNVTSIGNFAFSAYLCGNTIRRDGSVSGGSISGNVETVGDKTQMTAYNKIKSITFEEGSQLKTIGAYAFYRQGLKMSGITFPETLMSVGDYAFYAAGSLGSLTFSSPLTVSVASYAFSSANVTELHVEAMTSFTTGTHAFSSTPIVDLDIQTTGTITLGDYAFYNHSYLPADLAFKAENVTIGSACFYVSNKNRDAYQTLQTVTFNNATKISIGDSAFANNMHLYKTFMPALVDGKKLTLGTAAFGQFETNAFSSSTDLQLGTGIFVYYDTTDETWLPEYAYYQQTSEDQKTYVKVGDKYYKYIEQSAYNALTQVEKDKYQESEMMTTLTFPAGLTYVTGWVSNSNLDNPADKFKNHDTYYCGIDEYKTTLISTTYPTCTKNGNYRYEVYVKATTGTGTYYLTENIPALGHMYGDETVYDADCVTGEYLSHKCVRGKINTAIGVDADGYAIDGEGQRVTTPCTESGYEFKTETGNTDALHHEYYAGTLHYKTGFITEADYQKLSAAEKANYYKRFTKDGGQSYISLYQYNNMNQASRSDYVLCYYGTDFKTATEYDKLAAAAQASYTNVPIGQVIEGTKKASETNYSVTVNNVKYSTPFTAYNVYYVDFACYRVNHPANTGAKQYAIAYVPMTLKGTTSQTLADIDLGVSNLQWADPTQSLAGAEGKRGFTALFTADGNGVDYFKPVELTVYVDVTRDDISLEDIIFNNTLQSTTAKKKIQASLSDLPNGISVSAPVYYNNGGLVSWDGLAASDVPTVNGKVRFTLTYDNEKFNLIARYDGETALYWNDGKYNTDGVGIASYTNLPAKCTVTDIQRNGETVSVTLEHDFTLAAPSLDLIEFIPDNAVYDGNAHGFKMTNVPRKSTVTVSLNGVEKAKITLNDDADDFNIISFTDLVTNAGTYAFNVAIQNDTYGAEAHHFTVTVTIDKAPVQLPKSVNLTYNGADRTPYADTSLYTVCGEKTEKIAYNYVAEFVLKDRQNYRWEGLADTVATGTVLWSIRKLEVAVPAVDYSKLFNFYNGTYQTPYNFANVNTVSGTDVKEGDYKYEKDGLNVKVYVYLNNNWLHAYTLYNALGLNVGEYVVNSGNIGSGLQDNLMWPNNWNTYETVTWNVSMTDITLPDVNVPAAEYTGNPYDVSKITLDGSWNWINEAGVSAFTTNTQLIYHFYNARGFEVTPTDVGVYTVKVDVGALLKDKNYATITSLVTGTLQINKAKLSLDAPDDPTATYDGQNHDLPLPKFKNGDGVPVDVDPEDVILRYYKAIATRSDASETDTYYVIDPTDGAGSTETITYRDVRYDGKGNIIPYTYLVEVDANCANYESDNMVPVVVTVLKANQGITVEKEDYNANPDLNKQADGSWKIDANLGDAPLKVLVSGQYDKNAVIRVNGELAPVTTYDAANLSADKITVKVATTTDANVVELTIYFTGMADGLTVTLESGDTPNAYATSTNLVINTTKAKADVSVSAALKTPGDKTFKNASIYTFTPSVNAANVESTTGSTELELKNDKNVTFYFATKSDYQVWKLPEEQLDKLSTVEPIDIGEYCVIACYNADNTDENYLPSYSAPIAFEITKAKLEIEITGYSGTYDGQTHAPAVIRVKGADGKYISDTDYVLTIKNSNNEVVSTVKNKADSGTYTYTITVPNYDVASANFTVTISPRNIIAAPESMHLTKVYDGNDTVLFDTNTVTFTNVINNEITGMTATAVYFFGQSKKDNIRVTYTIVTSSDYVAGNYTVNGKAISGTTAVDDTTYVGKGVIQKRPLTITDLVADNREYDGTNVIKVHGTPTTTNIVPGDHVVLTLSSYVSGTISSTDVGSYVVAISNDSIVLSGEQAANYVVVAVQSNDITVSKRTLVLTKTDLEKTYTGATITDYKSITLTAKGTTYNNDHASVATDITALKNNGLTYKFYKEQTCQTEIPAPTAAGTYYLQVSLNENKNYAADPIVVKVTIKPATLTVTPTPYVGVYDAATHAPATFVVSGTAADGTIDTSKYTVKFYASKTDVNSLVLTVKNVADSKTYYYTVTVDNYAVFEGSVKVQITPKNVVISYTDITTTKVYDGNTTAAIGTIDVTGEAGSETITATASAAYNSQNVAAANTITVTYTMNFANGAQAGNYTYTAGTTKTAAFASGEATETLPGTITKYQLHVNGGITANDRVWDGTKIVTLTDTGITFNDIVAGESLTLTLKTGTTGSISATDVGAYKAVIKPANIEIAGTTNANYEVVSVFTPDVTISKATPTFTLPLVTVAGYSAKPVESGYYAVKVHANDAAKTILAQGTVTDITYTFWQDAACSIPAVGSDASVVPTNRLDDKTDKPYYVKAVYNGDTNHDKAETVFKLVIEKAGFDKLNSAAYPYVAVYDGKAHAVISGAKLLSSLNYEGANGDGNVTSTTNLYVILKTDASVTAPALDDPRWVLAFENGVPVASATSIKDVGSYTYYVKLEDNDHAPYVLPETVTAVITKAKLNLSADVELNKVYDGNKYASTTNVQVTGVQNGENVTVTAVSAYGDKSVGNYRNITTTFTLTFTGCTATNYEVVSLKSVAGSENQYYETYVGDITKRQITVYGASVTDRPYNNSTIVKVSGNLTITDLCAGDDLVLSFKTNAHGTITDVIPGTYSVYIDPTWITLSSDDDGKFYEIVFVDQPTITIVKADYVMSGITFEDITPTYDGKPHHPVIGGTLPTGLDGVQVTVTYDVSATDVADGTVKVTATFATTSGNYNAPASKTAYVTVQRANLTVDATGYTGTYDGQGHDVLSALTVTGVTNDGNNGVLDASMYKISVYRTKADRASDTNLITTVTDVADSGTYYYRVTSPNYNNKEGEFTVTINRVIVKAAYELKLDNNTRVYDATNIVTVSATTLTAKSDSAAQNALIASELGISATATFDNKNVGTNKTITVVYTITTLTDAAKLNNYNLESTSAALPATWNVTQYGNVTKKQIAVTGASATDFVYNHEAYVTIMAASNLTTTDLIAGDELTLTVTAGSTYATVDDFNVGTHNVTVNNMAAVTLGGADAGNYEVISVACSDVTISRADPTTSIPKTLKVPYSGAEVLPAYYVVGVTGVKNDTFVFPISYTFNGSTVTPTNAGEYTVVATVPTTTNYNGAVETFTLTIEPYDQSLGFSSQGYGEHVYDAETHKAVVVSNILGVNSTALSADKYVIYYSVRPSATQPAASYTDVTLWSTTATDVKHVGDSGRYWFAIVAPNYNTFVGSSDVTISPIKIDVVTTYTDTKVYDKTDAAVVNAVALTNVPAGDAALLGVKAVASYTNVNAGNSREIIVTYVVTFADGATLTDYTYGTGSGAYAVAGNTWTFRKTFNGKITPAPITITIGDQTAIYNKAEPNVTQTNWTVTSGTDYDNRALQITLTKANGIAVGSYDITGVSANGNYTVTFVNGTYTITPRPITVVINPTHGTYGEVPVLPSTLLTTADAVGTLADEIAAIRTLIGQLTTDATTRTDIGAYTITVSTDTDVSHVYGNYEVTFDTTNAVYTVDRRTVTITADSVSSKYNANITDITYHKTDKAANVGITNDDVLAVVIRAYTDASCTDLITTLTDVGEYYIRIDGYTINGKTGTDTNYTVTLVDSGNNGAIKYTVEKAVMQVGFTNSLKYQSVLFHQLYSNPLTFVNQSSGLDMTPENGNVFNGIIEYWLEAIADETATLSDIATIDAYGNVTNYMDSKTVIVHARVTASGSDCNYEIPSVNEFYYTLSIGQAINYNVAFYTGGATITSGSDSMTKLSGYSVKAADFPTLSYTGRSLVGWKNMGTGEIKSAEEWENADLQVLSNLALMAVWTESILAVDPIPAQTYTNLLLKPEVNVTCEGKNLVAGTDYLVFYNNNINAGTATVSVVGIGEYTGLTTETDFVITKAFQTARFGSVQFAGIVIGQKYMNRVVAALDNPTIIYRTSDSDLVTVDADGVVTAIKAGTATIYADVLETNNVLAATIAYQIQINATETDAPGGSVSNNEGMQENVTLVITRTDLPDGFNEAIAEKMKLFAANTAIIINTYSLDQLSEMVTGAQVLDVLDIYLEEDGLVFNDFSGTYTVKLRIPAAYRTAAEIQVAHLASNGDVELFETKRVGDYIFFDTTHFSEYVVLGKIDIALEPVYVYGDTEITYLGREITAGDVHLWLTDTDHGGLVEGEDYVVSYLNNVDAGYAKIIITGIGKYGNFTSFTTLIRPATLTDAMIAPIPSQAYTGCALTPEILVQYLGKVLTSGTDYTVVYTNNVQSGTATVTVTGKGNFTGTAQATFVIDKRANDIQVTLTDLVHVYDGTPKGISAFITYNGMTLVSGTDYIVTYEGGVPTNVGSYVVKVQGIGNYADVIQTAVLTITAAKSDVYFSDPTVTKDFKPNDYFTKTVIVSDSDNHGTITYVSSNPSVVTVDNNGNVIIHGAGTAVITATVAATENYQEQSASYTVVINPASIAGFTLGQISNQVYTGSQIKPDVLVQYISTILVQGKDYTLSYSNNVGIGTATVNVTGIGNYTGNASTTFQIVANGNNMTVGTISAVTFNGKYHKPSVTVYYGGKILTAGTDYTVTYVNNVNAGIATANVTGIGNYVGCSAMANFAIRPVDLSMTVITVEDGIFTGGAVTPAVNASLPESGAMKLGTDYTVFYADNIHAGTGTVTVTGQGNFTGTVTLHFNIAPVQVKGADIATISDMEYSASPLTPVPAIKLDGKKLNPGVDYVVTYVSNTDVGTATVEITYIGDYQGTDKTTFEIVPRSNMLTAEVLDNGFTYDGTAHEPSVNVYFNELALVRGVDYVITYDTVDGKAPVNAGTYVLTIQGLGNYTGTIAKVTVVVAKAAPAITFYHEAGIAPAYAINSVFGDAAVNMIYSTSSNGTVTFTSDNRSVVTIDENGVVTIVGQGSAAVTMTVAETENYLGATLSRSVTVTAKSLKDAAIEISEPTTFTGEPVLPDVVIRDGDKVLVEGKDYILQATNNVNVGTAELTIVGIGNYAGDVYDSFRIVANSYNFEVEPIGNVTYTGKAMKPSPVVTYAGVKLTEGVDYTVEYVNNTNPGMASVIINGIGAYAGCNATASFTIRDTKISGDPDGRTYGVWGTIESAVGFDGDAKLVIVEVERPEKTVRKSIRQILKDGVIFRDLIGFKAMNTAYDVFIEVNGEYYEIDTTVYDEEFTLTILLDKSVWNDDSLVVCSVDEDGNVVRHETTVDGKYVRFTTDTLGEFYLEQNHWRYVKWYAIALAATMGVVIIMIIAGSAKKRKKKAQATVDVDATNP